MFFISNKFLLISVILVSVLVVILLSACENVRVSGSECEYNDEVVFARVKSINNEQVTMISSHGESLKLSTSNISEMTQVNDYYNLLVRRHTSGGCSPLSVMSQNHLTMKRLQLSPSDGEAYQGAFILAAAKNCILKQKVDSCRHQVKLSPDFKMYQLALLKQIKPRTNHYCSPATIEHIWNSVVPPIKNRHIISCVKDVNDKEVAVEFVVPDNQPERLRLEKVYSF